LQDVSNGKTGASSVTVGTVSVTVQ
jgi:hypothetical protein